MSLSICIITKNAERDIARCLASVLPVADQVVLVDTGSTDKTVEVARNFVDPVFHYQWRNDFAAARNHSLMHARERWIMFMDSDDELTEESYDRINQLKRDPADCYFSFRIRNIEPAIMDYVKLKEFGQVRMFPNLSGIKFQNALHEDVRPSLAELGLKPFHFGDVIVNHYGYIDKRTLVAKVKRDIRLKLVELGFPKNAPVLGFDVGDYFCFYTPDTLTVWKPPVCVAITRVNARSENFIQELINTTEEAIQKFEKGVFYLSDEQRGKFEEELARLERAVINAN